MTVDCELWANAFEMDPKMTAPQRRALNALLLNCCFMMHFLPSKHLANFPVSWVEQNSPFERSSVNWTSWPAGLGCFIGARRSPSAKFHLSWPVSGLVNLRIWPSHAIDMHSGFFRLLTPLIFQLRMYLPTVAGAAHV